ncbi:MAG: 3'(2'),5'-bisphosphate nucleotidase CysQ [Deltaproteobacteria bacterium]|nr:3'(2'),5'-bisphosphate nucleotidase CysQ [Deltaproteobacteria bacterium]
MMNDTKNGLLGELRTAERAARDAGEAIMALYGKDYRIEEKFKGHPVTTADLEANLRIKEVILGRYPEDGWLSEESQDDLKRLKASRVWVIDPIDGTKEFIQHVAQFAVSIGLVIEGRPALGVVYNPVKDQLFMAVRDAGATLNECAIRISPREEAKGAHLLVSRSEPSRKFRLLADLYHLEQIGSIAYRLALVAGGKGDGTLTFHTIHEWDVCAGVMIVEEAGGVVVDGDGKDLRFNQPDPVFRGLVASNEPLTSGIQKILSRSLEGSR